MISHKIFILEIVKKFSQGGTLRRKKASNTQGQVNHSGPKSTDYETLASKSFLWTENFTFIFLRFDSFRTSKGHHSKVKQCTPIDA